MRFSKLTVPDEEAKDAFYQAVTKAYLSCKMEAKKTFGRKKKNTETESDSQVSVFSYSTFATLYLQQTIL